MKYVVILGILAVLVAGFAYVSLFGGGPQAANTAGEALIQGEAENQGVAAEEVTGPRDGIATLDDLRSWNENIECTITYMPEDQPEAAAVEGTFFVSDGDIRGDFLTDSPDLDGQVLSSMIITEPIMYIWTEIEGERYGMKLDLSIETDASIDINEPIELDSDVTYSCTNWKNVDRTIFVPPSDVLFQDLSQLMQSGMEYGTVYEEGEF